MFEQRQKAEENMIQLEKQIEEVTILNFVFFLRFTETIVVLNVLSNYFFILNSVIFVLKKRNTSIILLPLQENQKIMHIINEMPDKEKAKYLEMRSKNQELQQRAIEMQNELDEITKERDRLHVEISGSQLRLDAVRIF